VKSKVLHLGVNKPVGAIAAAIENWYLSQTKKINGAMPWIAVGWSLLKQFFRKIFVTSIDLNTK
jgi:hypothetical protein